MNKIAIVSSGFLLCSELLASSGGSYSGRSSRLYSVSRSSSVFSDEFSSSVVCLNDQMNLNPVYGHSEGYSRSSLDSICDPVELTLNLAGNRLEITNNPDFVHSMILEAVALDSPSQIWDFLKEIAKNKDDWARQIHFYAIEEEQVKGRFKLKSKRTKTRVKKSLAEMKSLVAYRMLQNYEPAFLFSQLKD